MARVADSSKLQTGLVAAENPIPTATSSASQTSQLHRSTASGFLFAAVAIGCASPLLFGFSLGFTSPAENTMQGTINGKVFPPSSLAPMTASTFAWYSSLVNVGAVAGAFLGSYLSDKFGRKRTLVFSALPHLIGWVCTAFATATWEFLILRLLIGLAVGMGSAVFPCYIGEISTPSIRGALGACNQLSVTIGIFLVNLVGGSLLVVESHGEMFCQWRHLAFMGAFLAIVLTGASVAPESPQWLAKGNFREGTLSAMRRLRTSPAEPEVDQIFSEMTESRSGGSSERLGQYKKSMVVAIGLCAYQQFSGVNAVMMYTTNICKSAGMADPAAMSTVVMGAQVVLTLISCVLMEKLGRRPLLLFGSASMAVGHMVLALYFFRPDVVPSMLALVALFVFILGFSWGLGPIPWIMMAEVFPTSVAAKCAAIATAVNWGSSFVVTLSFSYLEEGLTKEGTFLLLAVICVSCFFFTLFLVPETRGLSVDEVLVKLNGKRVRNVEIESNA